MGGTDAADTLKYLRLLSQTFPNRQAAASEIVNLETVQSLPKATEHFVSDIHGEYEAFRHVLRSCSGVLRRHISEIFTPVDSESGDSAEGLTEDEQQDLATLIYYPEEFLERVREGKSDHQLKNWYRETILRLVQLLDSVSSKYTRKKVAKSIPAEYSSLLLDLLYQRSHASANDRWTMGRAQSNQERYFHNVISSIIDTHRAEAVIKVMADVINRLAVDRLHVVGDIYDRGPAAHLVMEDLCNHHSVDIQWGNHDILWMAAAAGSAVALCTAVRISLRYSNMTTLEDAYGIAMLPLAQLALHYYKNDSEKALKIFWPKKSTEKARSEEDLRLLARMHKAIAIIQFKLEAQMIQRQPDFNMEDRIMLHTLDTKAGTIVIGGKTYKLLDTFFPTIDPKNPHQLTPMEEAVLNQLLESFRCSRWLQKHMDFMWKHGSMYTVANGNLLLHGALPLNPDGTLAECKVDGKLYKGREYCDVLERKVRQGITLRPGTKEHQDGLDWMYYLWTGAKSPLFGKARMTTFERYFIDDKRTHAEPKDPYLKMRHDEKVCKTILREFGLDPDTGVIINGHTPVKVSKGESPIKANGRLLVIDGGFSKAYQKETGIAGYTLIFNSYGLLLAEHKPFRGKREAVLNHADNHARTMIVRRCSRRLTMRDTDLGVELEGRIKDLRALLKAYEDGTMPERFESKL